MEMIEIQFGPGGGHAASTEIEKKPRGENRALLTDCGETETHAVTSSQVLVSDLHSPLVWLFERIRFSPIRSYAFGLLPRFLIIRSPPVHASHLHNHFGPAYLFTSCGFHST